MRKAAIWVVLWVGPSLALAASAPADDAAVEQAANDFRRRDTDQNQQLSLEELLANQPEASLPRLRQQFIVLDFNGDQHLSWDEFRLLPGRLPRELRGTVPEPDRRLAASRAGQVAGVVRGGRRRSRRFAYPARMAQRKNRRGHSGAGGSRSGSLGPQWRWSHRPRRGALAMRPGLWPDTPQRKALAHRHGNGARMVLHAKPGQKP